MARSKNFAARGLESLSSNDADFEALFAPRDEGRVASVQNIPITRIDPNPFQSRRAFEDIAELAAAIQTQGFVTRIRVRPSPSQEGRYQLVYGERRVRAAQMAGLIEIPCEIVPQTDDEMIEIGLAENIQRRALAPLEEARAFRTFIDQRGYTHARLAQRIGKDRSYVEDRLALLRMPVDVQKMVEQRPDTLRVAREIAKIPDADARQPLIKGVTDEILTQHSIRGLIRGGTLHRHATSSVAERAAPKGPETLPGPAEAVESPFVKMIARDGGNLRIMCSRWRQALPNLDTDERVALSVLIRTHLEELESIRHRLDAE